MHKIYRKIITVGIFVAGCIIVNGTTAKAPLGCWQTALERWSQCDSVYSGIRLNFQAIQGSPPVALCSATANAACQHDPYPSTCWTNAYNACVDSITAAWNNRATTYGDCLGQEGHASNCLEDVEFNCNDAANRAQQCSAAFAGGDDLGASFICRSASGVDSCQ